jgi:hypothetical protein
MGTNAATRIANQLSSINFVLSEKMYLYRVKIRFQMYFF